MKYYNPPSGYHPILGWIMKNEHVSTAKRRSLAIEEGVTVSGRRSVDTMKSIQLSFLDTMDLL